MRLLNTYTGHRSAVYALAPAAEPGTFFSAGSDGTVVRWNCGTPNDGTGIAQLPRPVFSVCHMNYHILAGLDDGAIHVLDLITQREVRNLRLHAKGAFALLPLNANTLLASAGGEGSIGLWHWPAMELARRSAGFGQSAWFGAEQ
ncbi:MAG: hypothetical protein IPG74_13030 [Flavobacteriales bacterium]|nr:hypothetical protein [Flavobacteriales bacterium]